LALDKVLPGRSFLEFVDVPDVPGAPKEFCYDAEWLAVMRSFHGVVSTARAPVNLPGGGLLRTGPSAEDRQWVESKLLARGGTAIPANFVATVPPHGVGAPWLVAKAPGPRVPHAGGATLNPQTMELLNLLDLPYNLHPTRPSQRQPLPRPPQPPAAWKNPEEIDLDAETCCGCAPTAKNPEEIDLDDDEDHIAAVAVAVPAEKAASGKGLGGDEKPAAKRTKLSLPPPKQA
jgi:hypothetical protein